MLLANYPAKGAEANFQHAAKQSYIALGTALIAAAEQEVDATPMEGFNPAKVDEILGLTARGLRSTVILPLGYREADKDWLVNMKKVRRTNDKFITEVK
jgi:nitroreductase